MTNIKEVIEIALNIGFTVKRYRIDIVTFEEGFIVVKYYDFLLDKLDTCEFSL